MNVSNFQYLRKSKTFFFKNLLLVNLFLDPTNESFRAIFEPLIMTSPLVFYTADWALNRDGR